MTKDENNLFHANYKYMWNKLSTTYYHVKTGTPKASHIQGGAYLPAYSICSKCFKADYEPSIGTVDSIVQFYNQNLSPQINTYQFLHEKLEKTDEIRYQTKTINDQRFIGIDTLMQQLVHTAATTPFGLEDVAQGAKQLLAYGFGAEKVNETLIRLGDIAAGLSIPLNDLVYLYGTTMSQGRLYTQDLNQFTGRGIPMIAELAKQFGVAESKVKELVEEGKVGFPEVQKVIESLTDEGGKFGGLMEAQSKTITGQISNIEDAVSMMFNEIGQQSEGVINTTLSGVSYMVEHYERFGRILLGLVGTYGVYRSEQYVTERSRRT